MEEAPAVIWVDHNMKQCKQSSSARRATYVKEYDLYVIDKPKLRETKDTLKPFNPAIDNDNID